MRPCCTAPRAAQAARYCGQAPLPSVGLARLGALSALGLRQTLCSAGQNGCSGLQNLHDALLGALHAVERLLSWLTACRGPQRSPEQAQDLVKLCMGSVSLAYIRKSAISGLEGRLLTVKFWLWRNARHVSSPVSCTTSAFCCAQDRSFPTMHCIIAIHEWRQGHVPTALP